MVHRIVICLAFLILVTTSLAKATTQVERFIETALEGNFKQEETVDGKENMIVSLKQEQCGFLECLNGGECRLGVNGGEEFCLCPAGYTGRRCEVRSPCPTNECQNGGTCVQLLGGYVCSCQPPYSGPNCETVHIATFFLSCDGLYLAYSPPGQPEQRLYPGNYGSKIVNGSLAYSPGSQVGGTSGAFYFNLEALPSIRCTLMHYEDDNVVKGLVIATDGGNGYTSIWGKKVPTFVLSKVDVKAGRVINKCAQYTIYCF